jgi:dynein heavy chain
MNTVLAQEVIRYNRLLVVMAKMLKDVQKALKGEVVMSEDLDKLATSMFNN